MTETNPEMLADSTTPKVPADYVPGYEKARLIDESMANNYIAHTLIGDPPADALLDALHPLGEEEFLRLITGAMDQDETVYRNAPRELADFFFELEQRPSWASREAFEPGIRSFHRNSEFVLQGFVGGSLVEAFSSSISRSFVITGRLREHGVWRLRQNNRHVVELFVPDGLERYGDSWKLSVRLRLMHAQLRRLLNNSLDGWDASSWGSPLSSAHMAFAASAFSARCLRHARRLGARFSREESYSFMLVWLYAMHLMGIPGSILPRNEEEALRLFEIGSICEPPPDFESIIMANALVNAAPLVLDVVDEDEKRDLLRSAFAVSRMLIGNTLADALQFPKYDTRRLLLGIRLQTILNKTADKLLPIRGHRRRFNNFVNLMASSAYEDTEISYQVPDHLYGERLRRW